MCGWLMRRFACVDHLKCSVWNNWWSIWICKTEYITQVAERGLMPGTSRGVQSCWEPGPTRAGQSLYVYLSDPLSLSAISLTDNDSIQWTNLIWLDVQSGEVTWLMCTGGIYWLKFEFSMFRYQESIYLFSPCQWAQSVRSFEAETLIYIRT